MCWSCYSGSVGSGCAPIAEKFGTTTLSLRSRTRLVCWQVRRWRCSLSSERSAGHGSGFIWGRSGALQHTVVPLVDRTEVAGSRRKARPGLRQRPQRRRRRLNPTGAWTMKGLDHFIAFDDESGVLDCEAGFCCAISRYCWFRGWMLPVRRVRINYGRWRHCQRCSWQVIIM